MQYDDLKDDEYWRDKLSPEEFYICRQKGTERAFTGAYFDEKRSGLYRCKCCDAELFDSSLKYDSGCGWPSFFDELGEGRVDQHPDHSYGMVRTEITCSQCGSHLGHIFPDGPQPTGVRYCVNSASLNFEPDR